MILNVTNYRRAEIEMWRWPNFSPREMACRKTGALVIDHRFMDALQALRSYLAFRMPVTSGYRSPEYDREIGGAGVHPFGCAADIEIAGEPAWRLATAAADFGFVGIGLRQHGAWHKRFVHLDTLEMASGHPRPRIWTYDTA